MISKMKFTEFLKYATCHKMQLKEFRFHANFKQPRSQGLFPDKALGTRLNFKVHSIF